MHIFNQHAKHVIDKGLPNPTLNLHSMNDSYSNPSQPVDFARSGVTGAAVVSQTPGFLLTYISFTI